MSCGQYWSGISEKGRTEKSAISQLQVGLLWSFESGDSTNCFSSSKGFACFGGELLGPPPMIDYNKEIEL